MAGNGAAPACLNLTNDLSTKTIHHQTSKDEDRDQDETNADEDFGEFESKGESLLNLVQPELVSLSQHWLAALRDHALLSLPAGIYLFIYINL